MGTSQADGDPLIQELEALLDDGLVSDQTLRTAHAPPVSPAALASLMPRYQLRDLVGAGGMGQVYDAYDTQLHRRVAIKVVARGGLVVADLMRRERKILAALEHPGIVGVFDGGELCEGQPYYVMQFVEGDDLRTFVARRDLSLARKLRLVAEIAEAVGVAHLLKVVHRDLKPSNIKVTTSGRPMVLDFGLAKFAAAQDLDVTFEDNSNTFQTEALGRVKGTLAYMSPEQAAGEGVDSRSDVYALGIILHELLTGELPCEPEQAGSTPLEWSRHLRSRPAGARLPLTAKLPWAVRAIDARCLACNPAERYATAGELADDLTAYLEKRPVAAIRDYRTLYLARVFGVRHRRAIAIATALVGVLAATVAMAFIQVRQQRNVAESNARRADVERLRAIDRENATRRYLYAADIGQAHRLWHNRQTDRAEALLDRYLPAADAADLRTFEWRFLQQLCRSHPQTLVGHEANLSTIRYSDDARLLASADDGGGIRIWDAGSGELLQAFAANKSGIRKLGFSPDASQLYTIGYDRMLRVWDTANGRPLRSQWWFVRPLTAVDGSPDGKRIAAGDSAGWVFLWEPQSGKTLGQFLAHPPRGVRSIAYSPTGDQIATGGKDGITRLWDAINWSPLGEFPSIAGPVDAIAFSPDGKQLATGGVDRVLRVWTISNPQAAPFQWQTSDNIAAVGFGESPGSAWAACRNGTVNVVNTQGLERQTMHAESARLQAAAVTPNLQQVATTSGDKTLRLWRAEQLGEYQRLACQEDLTPARMALSSSGRWLAVSYFNQSLVDIWDMTTPSRVARLEEFRQPLTSVAFSPNDEILLTTDLSGDVKIWQVATWVNSNTLGNGKTFRTACAVSPGGELYLAADSTGVIEYFSPDGRQLPQSLHGHDGMAVSEIQFSPDGRWLASGGWDKSIHIWDVSQGKLLHVLRGHQGVVHSVRFSPDGERLASGSADGTLRIWNLQEGTELTTLWRQRQEVVGLCFTQDGRTLAASSLTRSAVGSAQIRLWNIETLQETLTLEVGAGQIASLIFSPRDDQLLSGVGPGHTGAGVLIWQAEPDPTIRPSLGGRRP